MESPGFLLYGANGYTGRLIAGLAKQYGLTPMLAGRNKSALQTMAGEYGFPFLVFDLSETTKLEAAMTGIRLVLNAAGPFSETAKQLIGACIKTGTHYLDINGDISVFEMIRGYDAVAKERGILLLPGVGFDVVPTDCMALYLAKKLPDATYLKLAFATIGGGLSHGTAMTVINKLGEGGAERINGVIQKTQLGEKGMWIDFGPSRHFVMSIPWGDVATAGFTTGIPNITSYTAVPRGVYRLLKFQRGFNWLLRAHWIREILRARIKQRPAGPSEEHRKNARSLIWGEVGNAAGEKKQHRFSCADGYTLTAHASLLIAGKVLSNQFKPGYQTPASCYGEQLILEIPGTTVDMNG
jgi:short subunit dehydrogenase-like uncharacterized protein